MFKKPIETYPQDNFDYEAHMAEFFHTSAVYLGVNTEHITASSLRAWQPNSTSSREVQHA